MEGEGGGRYCKTSHHQMFRYNLSYYLPVYLWSADCLRLGVHPFWELLHVIGLNSDTLSLFGLQTTEDIDEVLSIIIIKKKNQYTAVELCTNILTF